MFLPGLSHITNMLGFFEGGASMPTLTMNQNLLAIGSGFFIGVLLSLAGGGGSALAIPIMMYVIGVKNPRIAMGTTIVAIALTALVGAVPHTIRKSIKWSTALSFTMPALVGLTAGRNVATYLPQHLALVLLGCLMLFNASIMISIPVRRQQTNPGPRHTSSAIMPLGFLVGIMAGIFGIGGGFLVLPTMVITGVPLAAAVGSSLVSVGSLGLANAIPYALRNNIDWRIVAEYVAAGALASASLAKWAPRLTRGRKLIKMLAVILVLASLYMIGINVHDLYT